MDTELRGEILRAANLIRYRHRLGHKYSVVAGKRQSGKSFLAKTLYELMRNSRNSEFNRFLYIGYREPLVNELYQYNNFEYLGDEYRMVNKLRGRSNLEEAILFFDEVNSRYEMIKDVLYISAVANVGHVVLAGTVERKLKPYDSRDLSTIPMNYMEALASRCEDDTIWLGDWNGE